MNYQTRKSIRKN